MKNKFNWIKEVCKIYVTLFHEQALILKEGMAI